MPRAGNRRVHLSTPSVPNTLAGLRGRRTASFRRVAPGYVGPCEESSEHVCTSRKRRYLMASTLDRFEITIDQPDVARFASHFELDVVYHGTFGSYRGRSAIREMSAAHHASGSMVCKRRMNRGVAPLEGRHTPPSPCLRSRIPRPCAHRSRWCRPRMPSRARLCRGWGAFSLFPLCVYDRV